MKITKQRPGATDTIYSLEVLRFIACVGVIFYHYQYFVTYRGGVYEPSKIPFESLFGWFYRSGGSGVQVFWCLSGIVFAHVYQSSIANRKVGLAQFAWRRFSRLYPLNLITLLIVACLCFVLRWTTNLTNFIYQFNDFKHFLLNLGFANYWGFQSGTSFNGPVWSVSIELITYMAFLTIAMSIRFLPIKLHSKITFLIFYAFGLWFSYSQISGPSDFIPMCIALFMLGAMIYTFWILVPDLIICAAIIFFFVDYLRLGAIHSALSKLQLPFTSLMVALFFILLALSPCFALTRSTKSLSKRLGSLTYAMYMIHFPIQFSMVIFSETIVGLNFLSHSVFIVFFALVVTSSLICHDKFEVPVQRLLRSRFSSTR
jgi:peptidoglycan/LPS O-acetylase OafA/YrhL